MFPDYNDEWTPSYEEEEDDEILGNLPRSDKRRKIEETRTRSQPPTTR